MWSSPGSVQICPMYPMAHWQVSLAIQAPLTQDGLQITTVKILAVAMYVTYVAR